MKKYFLLLIIFILSATNSFSAEKACEDHPYRSTIRYDINSIDSQNKEALNEYLRLIPCNSIENIFKLNKGIFSSNKNEIISYVRKNGKSIEVIPIDSEKATSLNLVIKAMVLIGKGYPAENEKFQSIYKSFENTDLKQVSDILKLYHLLSQGEFPEFIALSKKFPKDQLVKNYIEYDGFTIPLTRPLMFKDDKANLINEIVSSLEYSDSLVKELSVQTDMEALYKNKKKYMDFRIPTFGGSVQGTCGMDYVDRLNSIKKIENNITLAYHEKYIEVFKKKNASNPLFLPQLLKIHHSNLSEYSYNVFNSIFEKIDSGSEDAKQILIEVISYLKSIPKNGVQVPVTLSNESIFKMGSSTYGYWSYSNSFHNLTLQQIKTDLALLKLEILNSDKQSILEYLQNPDNSQSSFYKINDFFYVYQFPGMDKNEVNMPANNQAEIHYFLIFRKSGNIFKLEYLYIVPPLYDPEDFPC